MKKYKRNLLLGLFAATLTTMTSCLDVLDKEPLDMTINDIERNEL